MVFLFILSFIMAQFTPKLFSILKKGYSRGDLRKDLFAGLTVAIVALPLSLALGIASGGSPEQGILTAIIAGFLISFLGGSRVQIGGPTGAFVVIVHSIIQQFGYDGLIIATIMGGSILIISGYARVGALMKFIPTSVITGFTSGVAVIIVSSQIKDFLWYSLQGLPANFIPKFAVYFTSLGSIDLPTVIVGLISFLAIFSLRRFVPKLPRYLIVVIFTSLIVFQLDLTVATIGSRFGTFQASIPFPSWPAITFEKIQMLIPSAFMIAFLAGMEALLSAVVADGLTGYRHRPNQELVAQGVANLTSALFGGIPATGGIARTATNVTAGGKTPFAGIFHSIFLFIFIFLAGGLMKFVPMPTLATILFFVAWDMSEVHKFVHILGYRGPDRICLVLTFLLTVFVNLTVAIGVGVVLAALLFMSTMMRSVEIQMGPIKESKNEGYQREGLPEGVEVFSIAGPIFFGMAGEIPEILRKVEGTPKVLIIRMRLVPFLDISGALAIADLVKECTKKNIEVIFAALQGGPHRMISRMHRKKKWTHVHYCHTYDEALQQANKEVAT